MTGDGWVSEEQARAVLAGIYAGANAWQDRDGVDDVWDPRPGSDLAADDLQLEMMQASHLAQGGLNAAADNLQAVMALTVGHRTLHAYAPATQVRAVLESASMVIWLLSPDERSERLTRALRWTFTDANDERRALAEMPGASERFEGKVDAIGRLAGGAGLDARAVLKPVVSTEAVKAADAFLAARDEPSVLLPWRLTSGYAHGRTWAWLAFSRRALLDDSDSALVNVQIEFTNDRLAVIALPAFRALEVATALYDSRVRAR